MLWTTLPNKSDYSMINYDDINMSSLYTVTSGLLEIKNQTLDLEFIYAWIDALKTMAKTIVFSRIHTLSLEAVQLSDTEAYDIFYDFMNIRELNIRNSCLTSKQLTNLLSYINPYLLSRLDLTGSTFDAFDESDLVPINSLFAIRTLIVPDDMDPKVQIVLKTVLNN
jgi:hypothetical protein